MHYSRTEYAMRKRRFVKGFSMIEVMIVVLILGIVAIAGMPALNATLNHARLSAAAEEVVNALHYAQLRAMTSGRNTRVVIADTIDQIGVRQYTISANLTSGGNQLVAANVESGTYALMTYPLKKGFDYQIQFPNEDRFRGIDITASNFDASNPVDFNTLGSPSHGGTVTLVLKDQLMVVTLDALTGKVSVSE